MPIKHMETHAFLKRSNPYFVRSLLCLTVFVITITVHNSGVQGKVAQIGYPVGVFSPSSWANNNAQRMTNYGSSSNGAFVNQRPGYLYINGQRYIERYLPPGKAELDKIRERAALLKKQRRRLYRTRPLSKPPAFGQNYQKPEIHFPKLSRT